MSARHPLHGLWPLQAAALSLALAAPLWLPLDAQAQEPPATPRLAASSPAQPAGNVYKWKDASGRVHYGDQAPTPKADPMKLPVDRPSDADARAARERLDAMQAESEARAAERRARAANMPAPDPAASNTARPDETACEAKWREYNESYACFDPYRLVGGGIRPEAYAKCKVVKQPEPCH